MGSITSKMGIFCSCGETGDAEYFDNKSIKTRSQRSSSSKTILIQQPQKANISSAYELDSKTVELLMKMCQDEMSYFDETSTDKEDMIFDHNPRLTQMSSFANVYDLQKTIDRNYCANTDENNAEIIHHKTPALKPFRTDSSWDDDDLDDLSDEMTQEMSRLRAPNLRVQTKKIDDITIRNPRTNLLLDDNWSTPHIENEREAMKKEMFHLATSTESGTWHYF